MYTLRVKPDGSIVNLIDTRTNSDCTFTVEVENEADTEPHPSLVLNCYPGEKPPPKLLEALNATAAKTVALLPFFNGGAAHVLGAASIPKGTFYPLKNDYATCLTVLEINTRRAGGTIDDSFFTDANNVHIEMIRALNSMPIDHAHAPGLILSETTRHFLEYSSHLVGDDPLLKTFSPGYLETFKPVIQKSDYMYVAKSNWDGLPVQIKQAEASSEGQQHFYLVLRWTLPVEIVDQLKMLLYINPQGDSFEKFASRKILERATDMATSCSRWLVEQALRTLKLEPHPARPHMTHTLSNVFDSNIIKVQQEDNGGGCKPGVVFFEGCTPTHRARNGLVVERGGGAPGWMLFQGAADEAGFGGGSWKQPKSVSAFPSLALNEACWNQKMLQTISGEGGWQQKNGYFKLAPVIKL